MRWTAFASLGLIVACARTIPVAAPVSRAAERSARTVDPRPVTRVADDAPDEPASVPLFKSGIGPGEHALLTILPEGRGHTGTIYTVLPNGQAFSGTYVAMEAGIARRLPNSLVISPSGGWERLMVPTSEFPTVPAPRRFRRISAALSGPHETSLRCIISLERPRFRAWGGGSGWCESSTGERFEAHLW